MNAKCTTGRGRIDESGLSAATVYRSRRVDVEKLLDVLREEVVHHAEFAQKEGVHYGHCGDLGHVRDLLIQALAFLAQRDEQDIMDALRD